jgi:hypothetical protein
MLDSMFYKNYTQQENKNCPHDFIKSNDTKTTEQFNKSGSLAFCISVCPLQSLIITSMFCRKKQNLPGFLTNIGRKINLKKINA